MKTKNYTFILSFFIVIQIVCACFVSVLSLFPTDLFVYQNTFEPLFKNIPMMLFVGILAIKVINIKILNSVYPNTQNVKYIFLKIAFSSLDMLGLMIFTYMVIGWAKEFMTINIAMSVFAFIVYYILPFSLIIVCWLIQDIITIISIAKKDISGICFSFNKLQLIIALVLTAIGICALIIGRLIPVSVEEKLYGENFKLAIAEKYNDSEFFSIIYNENDMLSAHKYGERKPYYDITSGMVTPDKEIADTMIFKGNKILVDYTLYNNADGKTYKFRFIGERKWFSSYEFRLDCDIQEVLTDCPKM